MKRPGRAGWANYISSYWFGLAEAATGPAQLSPLSNRREGFVFFAFHHKLSVAHLSKLFTGGVEWSHTFRTVQVAAHC